ncbi:MAG TPA: hypothetical protein V6D00_12035 [Pantanalinema sp.]
MALDASGDLYVSENSNHAVRRITPGGAVTTFIGAYPTLTQGSTDGIGTAARLRSPWGLAFDGSGNLYVLDSWNQTIRKVTPARVVTTLASGPNANGYANGSLSAARFAYPMGLTCDPAGVLYVADTNNNAIRKVIP